jgi:hypothetical protein
MDLLQLSTVLDQQPAQSSPSVFCFVAPAYPLLFFSLLLTRIKKTRSAVSLDLTQEAGSIVSQLDMSFLGQSTCYWLGDLGLLDAKKKKYWLDYLARYKGPHTLFFFVDEQTNKETDHYAIVPLPQDVDRSFYQQLLALFELNREEKNKAFVQKLFEYQAQISLESACLLFSYQAVIGAGADEFIKVYVPKIIASEKSLFTLSQHFFAKSPKQFMTLWQSMALEYPETFWITFWSEQTWRAYYFVLLMKEKRIAESKKIAYRLPFSFIQRDWRKTNDRELRNVHDYLYDFDFKLKNGAGNMSLDLLYAKFFENGFG